MPDRKREKGTVLKQATDIFQDILTSKEQRGNSDSVYVYRVIGCDDEQEYISEITALDQKLKCLGQYVLFDRSIPVTTDSIRIEKVRNLVEQVELKDFGNGMLTNLLQAQGYFSILPVEDKNLKFRDAFQILLDLYLSNQQSINLNITANFVIKIICWFKEYSRILSVQSAYPPKLLFWGNPKVHEVYFLILMSQCGSDVLVINPSYQDNFDKVDLLREYCLLVRNQKEFPVSDFPAKGADKVIQEKAAVSQAELTPVHLDLTRQRPEQNKTSADGSTTGKANQLDGAARVNHPVYKGAQNVNIQWQRESIKHEVLNSDHIMIAKLIRSEDIFTDILVPLSQRTGFVGEPYPILPTYFTRYIGVPDYKDDVEAEYYNALYNLDLALKVKAKDSYLKFLEGIPAPDREESTLIPQRLHDYPYKDRLEILIQIVSAKVLPQTRQELLDRTITNVFVDACNLFAENNPQSNVSVLLNFAFKMVIWFNRYLPKLFKISRDSSQGSTGLDYNHNPKILYYGDIKTHEIYFLNALQKLGCDVLFVHSQQEGDRAFQKFDKDNIWTSLILNEQTLPLGSFPQTERLVRKSTVAYNASKEIEEVIYSEDVGLFKPWQFENYLTEPVTLKTTYDELKILWPEPAKTRSEFKVQNQKVYVPNLFAKINGVSENINEYWQDFKILSQAPNTKLVETIPFTHVFYSKQELFQAAYLLNEQGLFDEVNVMQAQRYKFGYLKISLQHFLVKKINELLLTDVFTVPVDEKFKLKMLLTILTMDDSILRLIEVFDFPQEIPKLVFYDNQRASFSEEDAILIAYLNLIGVDIVIFTPTNYATIDRYIKADYFDIHQLPTVQFELPIPPLNKISLPMTDKQGLLSRIFKFRTKNS